MQFIGDSLGSNIFKYNDGSLATNGKIYCQPRRANYTLEIDPDLKTTKLIGTQYLETFDKWASNVLLPDGQIFCPPSSSSKALLINPVNGVTRLFNMTNIAGEGKWTGAILFPNNNVYAIPASENQVIEFSGLTGPDIVGPDRFIPTDLSTLSTSMYNKYYNKF